MNLLAFAVFGLIVGWIARALIPGEQKMGLVKTSLFGMGGSFVGGLLGSMLLGTRAGGTAGWIGSVLGAVVLYAVAGWISGKKS